MRDLRSPEDGQHRGEMVEDGVELIGDLTARLAFVCYDVIVCLR